MPALARSNIIADDSAPVRRSLRSFIEQNSGWEICGEAENGKVAVEKVKELHPDIVILDFQMPVMNGLEAAPADFTCSPENGDADVYALQLRAAFEGGSRRRNQTCSVKI